MYASTVDQNPRGLYVKIWVGNPNLNKCLCWYMHFACKPIVSIGLCCVDLWPRLWRGYNGIKGLELCMQEKRNKQVFEEIKRLVTKYKASVFMICLQGVDYSWLGN